MKNKILILILLSLSFSTLSAEGLVFFDRVRVRSLPSLQGEHITYKNTGEIVEIYDAEGSASFENGVWDYWYKISETEDKWINAYYVALTPFYIDVAGENRCVLDLRLDNDGNLIFQTGLSSWGNGSGVGEIQKAFRIQKIIYDRNISLRLSSFITSLENTSILPSALIMSGAYETGDLTDVSHQDSFLIESPNSGRPIFQITVDKDNNSDIPMKYGISIGDSLESLTAKIGITELPASFVVEGGGDSKITVALVGSTHLERVIWTYKVESFSQW